MPGKLQLNDLTTTIAGFVRGLFAWPTVIVGMNGNTPVPITVNADGSVVTSGSATVTEVRSTALEASHILKSTPGSLKQLTINNTSGSTQYYLLMNSTTLPANGAVSLLFPPIPVAAGTIAVIDFPTPLVASTGIVICNGPNNSFTKAIGSADSIFYAQVI